MWWALRRSLTDISIPLEPSIRNILTVGRVLPAGARWKC